LAHCPRVAWSKEPAQQLVLTPSAVGDFFELTAHAQLRAEEGLTSPIKAELPPGATVRLVALGGDGGGGFSSGGECRRAKVIASNCMAWSSGVSRVHGPQAGAVGWITVRRSDGRPLIERVTFGVSLSSAAIGHTAEDALLKPLAEASVESIAEPPHIETEGEKELRAQEEAKQAIRHRLRLVKAVDSANIGQVRELLQEASEASIGHLREYARVEEEVRRAEDRVKLTQRLKVMLGEVRELSSAGASLDSLQEAKRSLSALIRDAREVGVDEQELQEVEQARKRIHNTVEDMKGSIRVFCRVRPLDSKEEAANEPECLKKVDPMSIQLEFMGHHTYTNTQVKDTFSFDGVFFPGTQEEVFEDCKDLVRSVLDGYNVTIFAYGQTGAGKTHTMYGAQMDGVAPRTIKELFALIDADSERFEHTVQGAMFEVYRNELLELLPMSMLAARQGVQSDDLSDASPRGSPGAQRRISSVGGLMTKRSRSNLHLDKLEDNSPSNSPGAQRRVSSMGGGLYAPPTRSGSRSSLNMPMSARSEHKLSTINPMGTGDRRASDAKLGVHRRPSELRPGGRRGSIAGGGASDFFVQHECKDADEMLALLREGTKRRHVNATAMNMASSRSHLILTITVKRTNKATGAESSSKIMLCDLAGSERLKKSLAAGDVQKEAIEINKSLTALGEVLNALTTGSKHIPYMNSKLTQVLRDALGGDSKTLMFVNCSPAGSNCEETRNTLKYAERAKKVTNKAEAHKSA